MIIRIAVTTVALAVALNATAAFADGSNPVTSANAKVITQKYKVRSNGLKVRFAESVKAHDGPNKPIARKFGNHRANSGGHRIAGTARRASPAKMKNGVGPLNRHTNPEFNKKYLKEYGESHAKAVDAAKAKAAKKQVRKKVRRKGINKIARNKARIAKRGKTIQALRTKAWELDGKPMKHGMVGNKHVSAKALPHIENSTLAVKRHPKAVKPKAGTSKSARITKRRGNGPRVKKGAVVTRKSARRGATSRLKGGAKSARSGKRTARSGKRAARAGRTAGKAGMGVRAGKSASKGLRTAGKARKGVRTAKKVGKGLRAAKGVGKFAAGGAAGMVAEAALGEDVPDIFDAAEYSVKLAKDPRNAPKMLANTAKGGVRMAGRMALTVTDPGKMARNLGGAAKGVGNSIARTGAYKKFARTKTGRTIGKGTRWAGRGVSKGYKTVARSRTGRAIGSAARTVDRQVFKRTNKGLRTAGKGLKKGGKVIGRTAKKTTRKIAKGLKTSSRKLKKSTRKVKRKVRKAAKKVAKKLKFW